MYNYEKQVKNTLSKLYEKYAKMSDALNKDGKPRQNSIKERLNAKIIDYRGITLSINNT